MSRDKGQFPGYSPGLRLSMRRDAEGGPVVDCVEHWKNQCRTQKDLLVLIHGFNNTSYEAQQAYAGFRQLQKALLQPGSGDRLEAMLGDGFWPGDANWAGPLDFLDFLVYPATIEGARTTAVKLAAYLKERTDVMNIDFVGHSMGCRVVLETIALMQADADYRRNVRKVCLMAAAVPTFRVCPGGTLESAFLAAKEVNVLYSRDDSVLSYAFPAGQTVAGDGFFPQAVGLRGNVPSSPGKVSIQSVDGAGHSDYWGWTSTVASAKAASYIRDFLAIDNVNRVLPSASVGEAVGIKPREEPPRRV